MNLRDVDVRQWTDPSAPEVARGVALLNENLGADYVSLPRLADRIARHDAVVVTAHLGEELVGSAVAELLRTDEVEDLVQTLRKAGFQSKRFDDRALGLLKTSAVIPRMRGQGIGSRLVEERLSLLANRGCTAVYTFSWESGSRQSSRSLFEAAGFEHVVRIPNYWYEPPGHETFQCIKCGKPCRCAALVMRRSLGRS